ncbi:MAG: lipase maturation factor family protein [Candidatus Caenarcaniphilales bacterium]|nr:lipase maturation factor family protein [Candidatus Caenarcaniphilales bacterium]
MNLIRLFIKLLSIIYFIAFTSALPQLCGLIGKNGILPANDYFRDLLQQFSFFSLLLNPTLFWLNSSNFVLILVCILGILFSVLLFFGLFEFLSLLLLWFLYLSVVNVGQIFFSYQWDMLLLESGFLSIFAYLTLFRSNAGLSNLALLAYRVLVFKLIFSSGLVKLLSSDSSWRDFSALSFHYETQPLPTWVAWYAHKLPLQFHKFSTFFVLFIELLLPFFIFLNRYFRVFAFVVFLFLQLLIMLTGNFTFFNLLRIFLCFTLCEEESVIGLNQRITYFFSNLPFLKACGEFTNNFQFKLSRQIIISVFVFSIGFSGLNVFKLAVPFPSFIKNTILLGSNWGVNSSYGLFAVMTKTRPEIMIEGSRDGIHWRTYDLPAKPGTLSKKPPFIAPNQPRLDWQLWFAALEKPSLNSSSSLWINSLMKRLLAGDKNVEKLFDVNPFSEQPPKYIRASIYEYNFSSKLEKEMEKIWWTRKFKGLYLPVVD